MRFETASSIAASDQNHDGKYQDEPLCSAAIVPFAGIKELSRPHRVHCELDASAQRKGLSPKG